MNVCGETCTHMYMVLLPCVMCGCGQELPSVVLCVRSSLSRCATGEQGDN